jgi:hypothetical protein
MNEQLRKGIPMKLTIYGAVVLLAVGTTLSAAQDTTVKSRTKIEGDEAQVVSMTGCLRQDVQTGAYMLVGSVDAVGETVTNDAKVKVDRDKDDTKVTAETRAKGDNGDKRDQAAAGVMSNYVLLPGNVNLTPHVGQRVQVAAAAVQPGHKDADVTVKDETKVDPEHGRDRTSREKTKVEIDRAPLGQYTVVSVKPLGGSCAAH